MGDLKSFQARFSALRETIVSDGMLKNVPFDSKDLQTLSERVKNEGTSFVKVTLPILGKALDNGLVTGHFKCPSNFRVKGNTCLPTLCFKVFLEIFGEDGIILPNPNSVSVYFLRQFLLLDSKLIFASTPAQDSSAVQGFEDRQRTLRKVRIDTSHPVLQRAKHLLGRVLSELDLSNIKPGHGPGSVAEHLTRFERWDFVSWPAKAERYYPYLVYGTPSLRASLERGVGVKLTRITKTRCCLVPKDFKGPRLISSEHWVNQYLQQGQMKALMQYVDHHPLLSLSIKLRDQSQNQRLAMEAVERDLVTLDLSNASDTVSTTLVWYLLSEVPDVRNRLMATRSDYLSHNGKDIKIVAFAPMGSATCFPVETLVFWALSMASVMLARSSASSSASKNADEWSRFMRSIASQVSVFGDDIIIPSDALDILMGTLTSVGCSVNSSKSCFATSFRESCGSEWMNGIDVTIIRNRRYHYESDRKIRDYPVLLELQRKFFLRGLFCTAELMHRWAREIGPVNVVSIHSFPANYRRSGGLPFGNPHVGDRSSGENVEYSHRDLSRQSGRDRQLLAQLYGAGKSLDFFQRQEFPLDSYPVAIGWQDVLDSASRIRFNRDYQRMEFRAPREFYPSLSWSSEDYPRLLARLLLDSVERIAIRNPRVKMAWSYLPFPALLSKSRDC